VEPTGPKKAKFIIFPNGWDAEEVCFLTKEFSFIHFFLDHVKTE